MLSSQLKAINEAANRRTKNLELNYKYDDLNDPEQLYYRSDHYNFAKYNIPVAFFFDGSHKKIITSQQMFQKRLIINYWRVEPNLSLLLHGILRTEKKDL